MKKGVILFLSLLITTSLFAQLKEMQIKGEPEKMTNEIVGKRDANGNFCAAIKVISNMEGLIYDSYNGVVEVDRNPGEDIVYLSSNERVMLVYNTGYNPKKVILTDQGIDLEPKSMWKITIVGEEEADKIPINIITDPAEAEVYIDGNNKGSEENHLVDSGSHTIRVIQEGYQNINDEIEVSKTSTLFKYTLQEEEPIMVTIKSQPEGAQISFNGVGEGQTNKQLFKFPGEYNLKISKNKYATINKTITVSKQGNNTWDFKLDKVAATIKVNANPSDADIYINGELRSSNYIEVSPGKYRIEAKKDGYYSDSKTISIKKGAIKSLNFDLKQKTGKLQVEVEPMETQVKMIKNGRIVRKWKGSKYIKKIGAGNYILQFLSKQFKTVEKSVEIIENETSNIDIKMIKDTILNDTKEIAEVKIDNMVLIEGGSFIMGDIWSRLFKKVGWSDEKPSHEVKISKFYINKYEATQKLYSKIMGNNPSTFKDNNKPVENVTWMEAINFCNKLSEYYGLEQCYSKKNKLFFGEEIVCDFNANGYRLPTEAEWEYAARSKGREDRKWSGTNNKEDLPNFSYFKINSDNTTYPVGSKEPNNSGLYDMSGNVWEWCWDNYSKYKNKSVNNPIGARSGTYKVLRGGSWKNNADCCRTTHRYFNYASSSKDNIGFRIVRTAK